MPIIRQLIVDETGAFVGKRQGRLAVKVGKETTVQAPLMHLEAVLITGRGITVSSDVVAACCEEGIPLHFVDSRGRPYGSLFASGLVGTVRTRRA